MKYYITTPIYYINDVPHIGHMCTTVAADILARWRKLKGNEVFFLTGTDEHGQKVAESAEHEGLTPQEYCDKIAPRFKEAWEALNIGFDYFIRTTDPRHEAVVIELLNKIYQSGDIYKAKYEGYYCIGCEKFITESELVDNHCPIHPPEKTVFQTEENWFFKLSKYVPKLIELLENNETNYVFPEGKKQEVLAKLKAGVNDISISREKVKWGINVPWDSAHTVYVWIEALMNYYSATRFLPGRADYWPATVHLIGKEILWFHTVIWQAMLLSAGVELPKAVFTHSFYIIDGQKMSKSLGNVISPGQLVEKYGVDGARYLIARSFPNLNDADVGIDRFSEKYNADLANNLGNLVSRLAKLGEGLTIDIPTPVAEIEAEYNHKLNQFSLDEAVGLVFDKIIDPINEQLNVKAPWKLEKTDENRNKIIIDLIAQLKTATYLLSPVMPELALKVENIFSGQIKPLTAPLFPRLG